MRRALLVLCTTFSVLTSAQAQQPAPSPAPVPQAPSGGLPEKIPFDIPYGTPITLERAKQLIGAVQDEASKRGWKFNIAVVDPNGDLLAFARMDGAQLASIGISQKKAITAARWRRESRVLYNLYEGGHAYAGTLDPQMAASPGGIPLVESGKIVGAIGCSGGTGDQDAFVCKFGADLVK